MEFEVFYQEEPTGLVRLCFLLTLDVELAADAAQPAQKELHLLPKLYPVPAAPADVEVESLDSLTSLPSSQREAAVLRYWADLSSRECAAVMSMGVSVGGQPAPEPGPRGAAEARISTSE